MSYYDRYKRCKENCSRMEKKMQKMAEELQYCKDTIKT